MRCKLRLQIVHALAAEGEDLDVAVPVDAGLGLAMLFQHAVKIGSTESERADAGTARVSCAGQPGTLARVDVERRAAGRSAFQRLIHFDRRRQHLLMQRHRRLDDAGDAGRSLGVADLRLHRAQSAPASLLFGSLENGGQRGNLGGIADLRAGAVSFDQAQRRRRHAGCVVSALQGQLLAAGARRINRAAAPVAGSAHALDHGVNAVAVALRIREALEHQHAQSFAQNGSVAVRVEGLRVAAGRERRRLAEAHVHEDVVEGVHAAGDDHVRQAGREFQPGEMNRRERTAAGRVHDAIGSAKIEAVGDAAGGDVPQQAGK